MPTKKAKLPDEEPVVVTEEEVVVSEPEPVAVPAEFQSLTPAEVNQAVAKLVGVEFTTRESPIGLLCVRGNGTIFSPVDREDHAAFAASRLGYDYSVGTPPRDVCPALLARAK